MDSGVLKGVINSILLSLLLFSCFIFSIPLNEVDYSGDPSSMLIFTYDRFPEVKHCCAPILPVLAELKPDDSRGYRIVNELKFENGEWSQEPDAVPLIPEGKIEQNDTSHFSPRTKLVSFMVTDVGSVRQSENMVSVSGTLEMSLDTTKLRIFFEGIYVESNENGGERHLCLLGTSWIPDSDASLNHVLKDGSSFIQDDQIMLWFRYPKTFTLTTRGIHGQMESLTPKKSGLKGFSKVPRGRSRMAATSRDKSFHPVKKSQTDCTKKKCVRKVSIFSQLSHRNSNYQFGSAHVLKACAPHKESDVLLRGDSVMSPGGAFCNYLQEISERAEFRINPNHTFFAPDSILGSLVTANENSQDLNFGNFKIVMRNLLCYPGLDNANTASVAAEFIVSSNHRWPNVNKSIFTEGIWSLSKRDLCMVGCIGGMDNNSVLCNYRVSVSLSIAFSIHRSSRVYGSITDINAQSQSDATVSFENVVFSPSEFLRWANVSDAYDFSKISLASAFKSRDHSASLVNKLKRTLLEYPSYIPNNHESLSLITGDLTVRSTAVAPEDFEACKCSEVSEACKILSLDLLFGSQPAENQAYSDTKTVVLSGYLSITGQCFSNVSVSVEGLYDPTIGTMHLIGCKDLRDFPVENIDSLEQGHDCMIEIEVMYPPTNVRWLLKQKLKISISSQREKQDSLYFSPIIIWTKPITYPWQLPEKEYIRLHEGRITISLMTVALFSLTLQLSYMSCAQGKASSSYVSMVMLVIQYSGYLIPFLTGSDVVVLSSGSNDSNNATANDLRPFFEAMMLVACEKFFGLSLQVRTSRRTKINSANDIKVLIITLSIHVLGLSIFLNQSTTADLQNLSIPLKQIKDYWGLVLDFFLLPQIIANKLWPVRTKPLSTFYYIGFSLVRIVPHLYVAATEDQAKMSLVSPNRFSHIAIAMTVILLAIVVYVQQRCGSGSFLEPQPEPAGESESLEEEKDASS